MGRHVLNGPGILKYLWISFWPGHGELFLSVVQVTGKADSPRLSTVLRVAPVFWGRPMHSCPSHTSHPTPSIALRASLGACISPVSSPLRTSTVQACSVPGEMSSRHLHQQEHQRAAPRADGFELWLGFLGRKRISRGALWGCQCPLHGHCPGGTRKLCGETPSQVFYVVAAH